MDVKQTENKNKLQEKRITTLAPTVPMFVRTDP